MGSILGKNSIRVNYLYMNSIFSIVFSGSLNIWQQFLAYVLLPQASCVSESHTLQNDLEIGSWKESNPLK